MKITSRSIKVLTVTGLGLFLGLLSMQPALATINLGTAGPGSWALLDIGSGTVTIDNVGLSGGSLVNGNAGISSPDVLTMSGSSFINGNLYLGNTATTNFSGGSGVTGTTFTNQDVLMAQARADALAAATFYAGLAPTPGGPTSIGTGSGNLTLTSGVYNLTMLVMGGSQTLTLNGAGDFVFNISGQMQLDASSAIVLTGGATDANVLFNITGTTTAGQSGSSVIHGIILAPHADVVVDGGTGAPPRVGVFGEVISGADIDIHSGSGINSPTVPDAGSALALMGLGLGFLAGAKRKFRS
jgi:hypothetical protein